MRTTVTFDDDIVAALRTVLRERDVAVEDPPNTPARCDVAGAGAPARPYQQEVFHAKVQPGVDLTEALQLAGDLEDDEETPRTIEFDT